MTTKAVLLDALGTLVELEPPWLHLAAARGIEPDERVRAAFGAEMALYRDHAHEAVDAESLAASALALRRAALARARLRRDVEPR